MVPPVELPVGVTGLKSLGVRDLQYKTAFLACMAHDVDARVSDMVLASEHDLTAPCASSLEMTFEESRMVEKVANRTSFSHSQSPSMKNY
jgi:hypothetical protein